MTNLTNKQIIKIAQLHSINYQVNGGVISLEEVATVRRYSGKIETITTWVDSPATIREMKNWLQY